MKTDYKSILLILIFSSLAPFLLVFTRLDKSSFLTLLGSFAGLAGTILLFWQVILGSRFISSLFSNDLVWFNKLHQKLGKYGVIVILLHPIIISMHYSNSFLYSFKYNFSNSFEANVSYGRIAFLLFLIIFVTSAILRKKLKYRPWLYIHYLAYPMLFFSLWHARSIGTFLNRYDYLGHLWTFMLGSFVIFTLYRLAKFYGWGKRKYELIDKHKVGDQINVLKFRPVGQPVIPSVGQFCYMQIGRFGENHPFTVMETDASTGELTFGIKVFGKFTEQLSRLEMGDSILIDGPYGVFTREGHNEAPKVLIAGGIGITPFVDLVRKYGDDSTYMIYANTFLNNAVRRDLLKDKLGERYFDVLSDEIKDEENILNGRLSKEDISKLIPKTLLDEARFFICGSKGFYDGYKAMLISLGVVSDKIHYEEFSL